MNRGRKTRLMRRALLQLGTITRTYVVKRDDDGKVVPKRERAYCVEATVNGYPVGSCDNSWYGAYQGALSCAEWAIEQPEYNVAEPKDTEELL
jgi:hypothetical protein